MSLANRNRTATSKSLNYRKVIFLVCLVCVGISHIVLGQATARQVIRGTVTSIGDGVFLVRSDEGNVLQVQPSSDAQIRKLPVGSADFKGATPATFADMAVGDRVLLSTNAPDSGPAVARTIFLMKASDIGQKQAEEQTDWQRRGIGGAVRSTNPAANNVTISAPGPAGSKNITIQVTNETRMMRYATDSVNFADAKPSSLEMIRVGDQLTARGNISGDGTTMTADELVTGSFRSFSGQIVKIDALGSALTVKDLATSSLVTVTVTNKTEMHMLTQAAAATFATRVKGTAGTPTNPTQNGGSGDGGKSVSSELTQAISRMPAVRLAQLKPGDALMIAASTSTTPNAVIAITLLSGVELILTATPTYAPMTLTPWNLSSGNSN